MISVVIPPKAVIPWVDQGIELGANYSIGVTSTYVKIPGWVAKSGYAANVVNDEMVIPSDVNADIVAYILFNTSSATSRRFRIMKNTSTQIAEVISSGTHSNLTLSLTTGTLLSAGDSLSIEGYGAGTASTRQINATSYLIVAQHV